MVIDILTKGLPPKVFHEHTADMCVRWIFFLLDTYL